MSSAAVDIVATPEDTEKEVVTAYPIDAATELIQDTPTPIIPGPSLPSLDEFIPQVVEGRTCDVCGLYIQGIAALKIVQQPKGNFVFTLIRIRTPRRNSKAPALFGVVGLLAHNFLAGRDFFRD